MENDKRIAVLIDADNVSNKYIGSIFNEIANYGTPTYKRIYADWTKPSLASWKGVLLKYSITPIQQYSYTTGKNSTDSALIIDAMDILYSQNVDGFCIVSSDSDFTRLATRLREAGMYVIGMGEKKTPAPFISACEKFKYLEVIANSEKKPKTEKSLSEAQPDEKSEARQGMASIPEIVDAIRTIITENSDEDGWAFLGDVGNKLNRRYPDFDTRNYGFAKLTPFIKSLKRFEIRTQRTGRHINLNYVRNID